MNEPRRTVVVTGASQGIGAGARSGKTLVMEASGTVDKIANAILGALGERDRAAFAKLAVTAL